MTSSAKMPNSVRSPYRNVAVVQLNQEYTAKGTIPKMISTRARGVLRVLPMGRFPANGKTMKSGYQQALAAARQRAYDLCNIGDVADGELLINATCA
jgi:hypothetical protein